MRVVAGVLAFAASGAVAMRDVEPVTKVVNLLKELKVKINEDGASEQNTYDKFACWCETTTQRKAAAILQAKKDIQRLGTKVLKGKGRVATLSSEIAQLTKDIAENQDKQAKATTIRQKENAAFSQEKSEMEQTLNALQRAVGVLSGAGSGKVALLDAKATIRAALGSATLNQKDLALVRQFLTDKQTYNPQSATITGILKDMYTTFAGTLEETTTDELSKQSFYEELMDTKLKELALLQKTLGQKEAKKAETEQQLAEDSQSLEDTTQEMNENADFFDATKKSCEAKSEEWQTRKTLRVEELDGVQKALDILSSDEARSLFKDAIKPGMETFLQVSKNPEVAAYNSVQKAAQKTKSLRLAALAVSMRKTGHFVDVIKKIDNMIQTLKDEGSKDKSEKDECNREMHRLSEKMALENHEIMRNDKKIEKLAKKIEQLTDAIAATVDAITETKETLAQMKKDRAAEKAAFEKAKADDEAAVALLEKATDALASYFVKQDIDPAMRGAFVQQEPEFEISEDQAPDATLSNKGVNQGQSKGIVSLLNMITNDLKNEISNGIAAEEASVKAYTIARGQTLQFLESLEEKKTNLEQAKGDTEEAKADEETAKKDNEGELKAATEDKASKQKGCDWLLGNFTKRANMRQAEMEGLAEAKQILAGMQATSLLSTKFDDKKFGSLTFNGVRSTGFLRRN